jgi:L-histidine N-alpha-methyltransferase
MQLLERRTSAVFPERFSLASVSKQAAHESFASAVRDGLCSDPKSLPCRFLYDARGSALFEQITEIPEYYPTRTERSILRAHAGTIATCAGTPLELVELGSGSASKTRLLIESLIERHGSLVFRPIDISASILEQSSHELLEEHPELEIHGLVGEYEAALRKLATTEADHPRLVLWLGSSIGNLTREDATSFLQRVRNSLGERDRLLVGIDLRKHADILELAYDDPAGITAAFNLNLLARINRELGGHFDIGSFEHRARYDDEIGRVEMHLVSSCDQDVQIDALGANLHFAAGEQIHTENSYKYSDDEIANLGRASDLEVEACWKDGDGLFSLNLLRARRA